MNRILSKALRVAQIAAIALCVAGNMAFAAGPKEDRAANVDGLMAQSGLNKQLEQFAVLFTLPLGGSGGTDIPEQFQQVIGIVSESLSAELLKEETKTALLAQYQDQNYKTLSTFFATDLGKRLIAAEIANGDLSAYETNQTVDISTISASRKKLLEAYIRDAQVAELQFAVVKSALTGLFESFNLILPPDNKLAPEMIDNSVAQMHDSMFSDDAKSDYLKHFHQTYAGFTDAELGQYFKLVSTPAGKWMIAGTASGVETAITKALAAARASITEQFQFPEETP